MSSCYCGTCARAEYLRSEEELLALSDEEVAEAFATVGTDYKGLSSAQIWRALQVVEYVERNSDASVTD